jgi:hypothetical protein
MTRRRFKDLAILFSHIEILRQGTKVLILVYVYDAEKEEFKYYGLKDFMTQSNIKKTLLVLLKKYLRFQQNINRYNKKEKKK